ncbi:MAG: cation transporter, partial [Thermodesulfobacteriota bacterium]
MIKTALEGLEGVKRADVNFEKKCGEISFDPDRVSEKELVKKINQIGFKAK